MTYCRALYVVLKFLVIGISLNVDLGIKHSIVNFQSPPPVLFYSRRKKWQPTPVFLPWESRDGGAWWAAVYGVAQSRTLLKWLSSSSSSRKAILTSLSGFSSFITNSKCFESHYSLCRIGQFLLGATGFPCGLAGKESTCNMGDLGSILGLGRSPGKGKGYPFPVFSRIPTVVFWPGEFHGLYSPWAEKELDTMEQLSVPWGYNCILH